MNFSEIVKTLTGGTSEKTTTFDLTDTSSQLDILLFMVYSLEGDMNIKNVIKNYCYNASSGALNPDVVITGDLSKMYKSTLTTDDFLNTDQTKNIVNRNKLLAEATSWANNNWYPLTDYSSFLPLKTTMNNGSTFNYGLSFESVSSSKATVKITAF